MEELRKDLEERIREMKKREAHLLQQKDINYNELLTVGAKINTLLECSNLTYKYQ